MANPAPTINQINAFNATQGTTIDFNIIGGTELVRSNKIYIYDLSDNSLICTHLYASTESIHELPPNTDGSIVYESGKSSADFVNGAQYYAQIQTFTDIGGTEGGSGLSVAKMFWCLVDPSLTISTIPSSISTTSYNVSATYDANTSVVSNIIQQYQFSLYSATGSLLQSSGVVVGSGTQQGTSTTYDISYNFTGLSVGSSYYVVVDVTTTQGMSVSTQSSTFTVSIDTPTLGEATVVNNACDGYISVTSNLSSEYGGSGSGDIVSFETDSENVFTKLQVALEATQSGSGTPSPSNVRPIYGVGGVDVVNTGVNIWDEEWVNGYYKQADGTFVSASNYVACKNLIPILPSTSYYVNCNAIHQVLWYDKDKTFISANTSLSAPRVYTSPNNAYYMAFYVGGAYGTTYNNDISINYPSTDHDYHAYDGQTVSQEFDVSLTPTSKDTDPYLFKAVGDIYGDRLEEDLVGGTVCWNQLVQSGYKSKSLTPSGSTTYDTINSEVHLQSGRVYFVIAEFVFNGSRTDARPYLQIGDGYIKGGSQRFFGGSGAKMTFGGFGKPAANVELIAGITTAGSAFSSSDTWGYSKLCVFDVTQMLGSVIADYWYSFPVTTAQEAYDSMARFKLFAPKDDYDYDTGTLKSVNPTAHITRGVNAWDGTKNDGAYWSDAGVLTDYGYNSCTSKIRVLPNEPYYLHDVSANITVKWFTENMELISKQDITAGASLRIYTSPLTAYYVIVNYNGSTFPTEWCINISDPTINGQYFPYEEHTYDLGNVELRGIPKLVNGKLTYDGDIRKYDGTVTRKYGIVDLGTLTWSFIDKYSANFMMATLSTAKANTLNMVCGKGYKPLDSLSAVLVEDKSMVVISSTVRIRDDSYSDAASFKTAMSGVYLVYELATQTTETADPFTQIQEVSKYGTLEYITTNDVPVGHNTTYYTRDVFGGYIDLVSGQLVVDRALSLIDETQSFAISTLTNYTQVEWTEYRNIGIKSAQFLSDRFDAGEKLNGIYSSSGAPRMYFGLPTSVTTQAQAQAWFKTNPTKVIYPLATPLTYQLTPQQIQTLVGVNNVWSEQGNVELSYHIPITNLLVKRQDVDDVSGNWLTLYSQPVEQASDMDFTFIDFLNQYGKTYKYALVPLLTQTQSGVEVEVEGGYTVSDEVQSIFDGVFISDSTGSQKCKANVGYGNVNMNQSVGSITPIGSQYPIIVTNSNNRYHNGSISGMIVPDDYYYNGNLSRIDMVNKRNELEQFLTNKRAKIIKDWNSNIWLVMIMDNIDCSFDNNYGMGIVTFNANWLEVGDPTNQEDLQATGLVDVGGV